MASVNIIVTGIAITYHKNDGLWRVLFPFGECHLVKFKENEDEEGIELAMKNGKIRITTEGAKSRFEVGDDYTDFLDLTADYSHTDGVKLKNGWQENAVLMTIENAGYSVGEYTTTEHLMVRNNRVTLAPQNIAYSSRVTIEAERVIVNVDGHDAFPKIYENDTTLIFDNDCKQGEFREISDLEMVYNVLEDAENEEKQCVVAKVPENIETPITVGSAYGNSKDSYARGLPCHGLIISQSENLP